MRHGKPNRVRVQGAKLVRWWCFGCDAQLVEPGRKCPNCGRREGRKAKVRGGEPYPRG